MKTPSPLVLTLCFGLTVALTSGAWPSPDFVSGPDTGCGADGPKNATFTPARFTYVSAGSCQLVQTRANSAVTAPWTGVGTYDPPTGYTAEDIIVPAPRIDQPSRPYGRFQATMHCNLDPWLNTDVKCDHIVPSVYAPLDNAAPNALGYKQQYPLAPMITNFIQQTGRPFTSTMSQDAHNRLNQQYGAYLAQQKTEMQSQKFQHELQMKPGLIRPRGTEGEQPGDPVPGTAEPAEHPNEKKSE